MREFNLDRLRTLIAVADRGSFAAAAQALRREVLGMAAEMLDRTPAALEMRPDHVASPDGSVSAWKKSAASPTPMRRPSTSCRCSAHGTRGSTSS